MDFLFNALIKALTPALVAAIVSGCSLSALTGCARWGEVTYQREKVTDPNDPNAVIFVEGSTPYDDQLLLTRRAAAFGFKGRLHIHGGPIIICGFVIDSGVHWDADLTIDPPASSLSVHVFGACCLPDGSCDITTSDGCNVLGGVAWLQNTPCEQAACTEFLAPVEKSTTKTKKPK